MKPDDIKGLKLRTLPSAVHVAYFRALGAIPTPMDWAEVMPALQQGVIDGQENRPRSSIPIACSVPEIHSLTSHVNEPNLLLMSAATSPSCQGRAGGHYDGRTRGDGVPAQGVRRVQHRYHGRARQGDDRQRGPGDTMAHFRTVAQSVTTRPTAIGSDGRTIIDQIVKARSSADRHELPQRAESAAPLAWDS